MQATSHDVLAISGIVRLLCHVRLVALILALVSLFTTSDTPWLPSTFVVIFALPLSYFPARTWNRTGEQISRSGILLACDLAVTAIVIAVTGGSQLIYVYAIATTALYGTMIPLILAVGMSSIIALTFLAIAPVADAGVHWALTATIALAIPLFAFAGNALGSGLRSNAAVQRQMARLEQEEVKFKERTRIARDIHDTVAGDLAGTLMLTSALQTKLIEQGVDAGTLKIAAAIEKACQEAHLDTRTALAQLRESDLSLAEKLRKLCREWSQKYEIELHEDIDEGLSGLRSEVENDLYLIARELLENVRKHAAASQVQVEAALREGQLVLSVKDDGIGGINRSTTGGYGLQGIRERLGAHAGKLHFEPAGKVGTHARVEIPQSEVYQT